MVIILYLTMILDFTLQTANNADRYSKQKMMDGLAKTAFVMMTVLSIQ